MVCPVQMRNSGTIKTEEGVKRHKNPEDPIGMLIGGFIFALIAMAVLL